MNNDDTLVCFLSTLSRLEEAVLLPPSSLLEQEGTARRMGFAVDAGWKAMKARLQTLGETCPTPPAVLAAAWRRHIIFNGHIWMDMLTRRSDLVRDNSPETIRKTLQELETRFLPELACLRAWFSQHPLSSPETQ